MATFLKNLARLLGPSKSNPELFLAAFGKHPGWNDHIDDLGLDTDQLVAAKRLLYVHGINQNVDSAAWEKLEPSQRVDKFQHSFLWHMPGAGDTLIAGRLWSSVDGKGRNKYPMVVCVETIDLPDNFAATVALPFLGKTQERCAATTEAGTVRRIIDSDRDNLRGVVKTSLIPDKISPAAIVKAANHADMHADHEGFHRIVYQITRGMSLYRPANVVSTRSIIRRAEQIRVPTCGMRGPEGLLFWLRFLLTLLDPSSPILLLAPDSSLTDIPGEENGWIDIIVGEPTASNLFCIKAKNKTLPLSSDIPYTLDPSFRTAVEHFLKTCAALPPGAAVPAWPPL